jgi:hypothetical protein
MGEEVKIYIPKDLNSKNAEPLKKMINDRRNMLLLKELVRDWHAGKLSSDAAMTVVSITVSPQKPSKQCIEQGKKALIRKEG